MAGVALGGEGGVVVVVAARVQLPLIQVVESDDIYLKQHADVPWFGVLRDVDWIVLRPVAARYYEALWQFNVEHHRAREQRLVAANTETREQATVRLLLERPTLCADAAALHRPSEPLPAQIHVCPDSIAPGLTPYRVAGKQPKCFFALAKAFLGMAVRGRPPEPDNVHDELKSPPGYARACGCTLPNPKRGYRQSDIPSLRKIEQFDQIMTGAGLWRHRALEEVRRNLQQGVVQVETRVVHDTTHYPAFSARTAVPIPAPPPDQAPKTRRGKKGARGAARPQRKAQSRTIKSCRCSERAHCPHPWQLADAGAGTVVKSANQMYWAHKASTLVFPQQGVLLDAAAMRDAASHDSTSLLESCERLFADHPTLHGRINTAFDDGAADDVALKAQMKKRWEIELMTPINPRRRKAQKKDLGRGLEQITAMGTPVCRQGFPFDFVGCRHADERFIFRAPNDATGTPVCTDCPGRTECYRGESGARQVTIAFKRLPWIDPAHPQLSVRFQNEMALRTAIERVHKQMKYDLGSEELSKRGNDAFQARLDKTLWATHILLRYAHNQR